MLALMRYQDADGALTMILQVMKDMAFMRHS
jgi:hypothetical protein